MSKKAKRTRKALDLIENSQLQIPSNNVFDFSVRKSLFDLADKIWTEYPKTKNRRLAHLRHGICSYIVKLHERGLVKVEEGVLRLTTEGREQVKWSNQFDR